MAECRAGARDHARNLTVFTTHTPVAAGNEVIPDAETFYQQIQPYMAAGKPTGWDIAVITNGGTFTKMKQLGQLVPLPADKRPNFDANASDDLAKNPTYDPGNQYSMP